jgi:hypothetical protein
MPRHRRKPSTLQEAMGGGLADLVTVYGPVAGG